jgi:hypothetical protein
VTPEQPAEHAIIIVDGLLTVWDKPDLGFHALAAALGGDVYMVYPTKEQAEAALAKLIDSKASGS